MRRICAVLLLILLLFSPVLAHEIPEDTDLETILADYMEENGLEKGNFALSYYNTVTGEAYAVNDTVFMPAASTFKLPLNMYYYELERDGKITPDTVIPSAKLEGVEYTLEEIRRASLIQSDNDTALALLYNLGEFPDYKTIMRDTYFHMPKDQIEYIYYADNYYCTNMMMDALKYLYENSGDFEELLDYLKQAQPDTYFRAYVTEYEVAHKYGWFEGTVNDVGIFYTPEPFLLAVYTKDLNNDFLISDVAQLVTEYNVANAALPEPEPEPEPEEPELPDMDRAEELEFELVPLPGTEEEPEPEMAPEPEPEPIIEEEPAPEPEQKSTFAWWMISVALGVFAVGGGGAVLIINPKRLEEHWKDEPEEENDIQERIGKS